MYRYDQYDQAIVDARVDEFRDQVQRRLAGELSEDQFKPLRLKNGLYLQLHAYMLRVAIPYGTLDSRQMRMLAHIARTYDRDYGHFTTRQNIQYNWIKLDEAGDILADLATVEMHAIQTSGNCIRNISSDQFAGAAADEVGDPRPWAELLRQWSTFHPEFSYLPRKFKIAVVASDTDRAAIQLHDIGLQMLERDGRLGFRVFVGGGMGRTPMIGPCIRDFLPAEHFLSYQEAILRVYNRYGRRDNIYKARIKILVKAEGQSFFDQVEAEYKDIVEIDGAPHTITQAELDRVSSSFIAPDLTRHPNASRSGAEAEILLVSDAEKVDFGRWLQQNVAPHKNPDLRIVTLSFKRLGQAPGDATADQLDVAADLADKFSAGEARVTHDQNLVLPWVHVDQLPELWQAARKAGFARSNVRLLTDMIACPGGDFCSLANARSLPLSEAITRRYDDMDELHDLGEVDLHISGCINSCGHHHSGHIGILGVDKDGKEWYQITLGGSDGSALSGAPVAGKVVGPSFSATEVPDVIEAVLDVYRSQRLTNHAETFIAALRRLGVEPFKLAANGARHRTGQDERVERV